MFNPSDRALLEILTHPTALEPLPKLEAHLGLPLHSLYIKRDDELFDGIGGNKARKLEFVLGDLKQKGIKDLITFGAWGSNHVLITALCAKKFGFNLCAHLSPQPITEDVRNKLLLLESLGVELHPHANSLALGRLILKNKHLPGYIHPGASSALGSLGYVNAAFELASQLKEKNLEDKKIKIFLPAGSLGTTAGLLVGFALQGFSENLQVMAVQVVPLHWNQGKLGIISLVKKIIPLVELEQTKQRELLARIKKMLVWIPFEYRPGYGKANPIVHETIELIKKTDGIPLDATYTGKALYALVKNVEAFPLENNQIIIFWNTYPKIPFALNESPGKVQAAVQRLPKKLQQIFNP